MVALFGPTGSGKTAIAIHLARYLGARVISCDSMQLYRGLPVLTNQPTPTEASLATHALVGEVDPGQEWTAAVYAQHAQRLIDEDVARRGWALLVGGTGLYMRAALAPLAMRSAYDHAVRAELAARAEREGSAPLHAELAILDPQAAAGIHPHNLRRIIRALEVVKLQGRRSWSGRADLWAPEYRHDTLMVGLLVDREELYERIDARVQRMLAGGALEEVAAQRAGTGGGSGTGVTKAIGYSDICAYLDGLITLEEVAARMAAATRRYAKRQLTWQRRLSDAVIIETSGRQPADVAAEIVALAKGKQRR